MIPIDELMTFLNTYIGDTESAASIDPIMANGLQVRGRDQVHTIVTGVSASLRFFEEALKLDADALIVHHSINMPASIHFDQLFSRRLRYLWDHDLSLIGYHYLLDSHPEVGNNAQIIKKLGGEPVGAGWVKLMAVRSAMNYWPAAPLSSRKKVCNTPLARLRCEGWSRLADLVHPGRAKWNG
jgi:putative NIF3 family GTP cyclohydrolase 1 type 2